MRLATFIVSKNRETSRNAQTSVCFRATYFSRRNITLARAFSPILYAIFLSAREVLTLLTLCARFDHSARSLFSPPSIVPSRDVPALFCRATGKVHVIQGEMNLVPVTVFGETHGVCFPSIRSGKKGGYSPKNAKGNGCSRSLDLRYGGRAYSLGFSFTFSSFAEASLLFSLFSREKRV